MEVDSNLKKFMIAQCLFKLNDEKMDMILDLKL